VGQSSPVRTVSAAQLGTVPVPWAARPLLVKSWFDNQRWEFDVIFRGPCVGPGGSGSGRVHATAWHAPCGRYLHFQWCKDDGSLYSVSAHSDESEFARMLEIAAAGPLPSTSDESFT
jgi:hypothetical protein